MAARIRAAMSTYGSPHDGRTGLRRCHQLAWRRAPSPTANLVPSKWFHGSISRSSTSVSRPNWAATGVAVSSARSIGEDRSTVTSRPARKEAAALAMSRPSSDRWKPGSRP